MAKMCIVPVRMNGSDTSPVRAVFHPKIIAHCSRSASSWTGIPRPSAAMAHAPNRSAQEGALSGPASRQSAAEPALSWKAIPWRSRNAP